MLIISYLTHLRTKRTKPTNPNIERDKEKKMTAFEASDVLIKYVLFGGRLRRIWKIDIV